MAVRSLAVLLFHTMALPWLPYGRERRRRPFDVVVIPTAINDKYDIWRVTTVQYSSNRRYPPVDFNDHNIKPAASPPPTVT